MEELLWKNGSDPGAPGEVQGGDPEAQWGVPAAPGVAGEMGVGRWGFGEGGGSQVSFIWSQFDSIFISYL